LELRRLCVFCGSSVGGSPIYAEGAAALGRALVAANVGLVYGGGSVGLMGVLADTMLTAGGHVVGVIPQSLLDLEVGHRGLSDLRVVESMHERKALMAELADAFVALPGGIGTLEEFFEAWTWTQLGVHAKPCGLLNVAGYYAPLLACIDHMVAERFLHPAYRAMVLVEDEPAALLTRLAAYTPPDVPRWLDPAET
jgi:uncharacterized protein (TIGR00730 family)